MHSAIIGIMSCIGVTGRQTKTAISCNHLPPGSSPHSIPLRSSGIGIHRQRLDEARFERQFLPANKATLVNRLKKMVIPPEPVWSALKPPMNKKEWRQFVLVHLPILSWVWSYQPAYLFGDIIAGITVAIMHIPQGNVCVVYEVVLS